MSTTRRRRGCCNVAGSHSKAGWRVSPCCRTSAPSRRTACSSARRSGDDATRGGTKYRWHSICAPSHARGSSPRGLAAAGPNAGGLGFVAAGYLTAEVFAERLAAARKLTSGAVGANLFVPQPSAGTPQDVERYAKALAPEAERYGAQLGEPRDDDDHWAAKIEVLLDLRPDVASFTFGMPSVEECRRLREAGITVAGTVTTLAEAQTAVGVGVDVLAAQGPSAGGHRGTFDPVAQPAT